MPVEPQPPAARGLLSANAPPHWTSDALARIRHGFFGRRGGVSTGIYASLNAGTGSNDDAEAARENRTRIAGAFNAPLDHLIGVHQVHSPTALFVSAPWPGERPHADALVTTTPGLVVSILTADCTPVLFADEKAGVVAAAHAGWKGAISGVLENTVALMREHGATAIAAAIGPCIHQTSYEVGPEFRDRFIATEATYARFFAPGANGKSQFDLPGFCAARLEAAGVSRIEALPLDTYVHDDALFSHRRAVHRNEADYGRNCAAIALG